MRTDQSFLVPKAEIARNEYDLSINRYKEVEYEEVEYERPPGDPGSLGKARRGDSEGGAKCWRSY